MKGGYCKKCEPETPICYVGSPIVNGIVSMEYGITKRITYSPNIKEINIPSHFTGKARSFKNSSVAGSVNQYCYKYKKKLKAKKKWGVNRDRSRLPRAKYMSIIRRRHNKSSRRWRCFFLRI